MDDKMNDVIDEVQKRLGEEYEVKRVEVMKNNDTKLKGIQVRKKDMNVAKICYWTSESVDEIVAVINRGLFPKFDCEINLEKLKERIVYTLVNANSNKSRLKTIPYRMLEGTDLAITYKLIIDIDFNATASSDVTYEVKRVEVMKNNDTKLKGIQVRRKDMNVAKICYWTSESVDEIVAVINRSLFPKFDCEINLEKLKDRIVYTLVNADSNKSRLKTIPYRLLKGTDLAITYKLIIDIDFNATASSDV